MEHRRSFTGHIQKAFEMHRKPTPKQQEYIDLWQDRKIPLDLITYAYEKTLESIDKLSFPYLDSILTRWMNAGYRTRTDVDTKDRGQKSCRKERRPQERQRRGVSILYPQSGTVRTSVSAPAGTDQRSTQ